MLVSSRQTYSDVPADLAVNQCADLVLEVRVRHQTQQWLNERISLRLFVFIRHTYTDLYFSVYTKQRGISFYNFIITIYALKHVFFFVLQG